MIFFQVSFWLLLPYQKTIKEKKSLLLSILRIGCYESFKPNIVICVQWFFLCINDTNQVPKFQT
jgi:hypothetical protein